jgi:hypothetical protein
MDTENIAALGLLLLLGIFIGYLLADNNHPIDFALVTTKQGIGCRVSSKPAFTM